jgi:biotin transport system ATP-binding protein
MLIEFDQVVVHRADRVVLSGLDCRLQAQRIGVVGPNGAGKSTFARLINGLVLPATGQVRVNGRVVGNHLQEVRRQVGFLFQNPDNQMVFPVVREDMAFGLKHRIADPQARDALILSTLRSLGVEHLVDRLISGLSGGEKQLVALASVLCTEPDFLVLDEPTTQLDLRFRNRFLHILQQLPKPMLVLTHDLPMLADFDRVLVIDQGRIVRDGAPADTLAWYTESFG